MTRWSPGRIHGRPRAPRGAGPRRTDDVATDRLPAQPPGPPPPPPPVSVRALLGTGDQLTPEPRPRTAPMAALHGQRPGRGPDPWTARAAELLDQHLQQLITLDQLTTRLAADVWHATTPRPGAAIDQLHAVLDHHGPALHEHAARYTRTAAAADRCTQCSPHRTCPMHLHQLRRYWDALHPVAARIAHPPR